MHRLCANLAKIRDFNKILLVHLTRFEMSELNKK